MKLNLKFLSKISNDIRDTEIIFLKQKNLKSNYLKKISKSVFSSKLFNEQKFLYKDFENKSFIFANCLNSKYSSYFEKLGSKL